MVDVVKVGLLGFGTVGSSLAKLLDERQEKLEEITDLRIELSHIAVRDPKKYQFDGVSPDVTISSQAEQLIEDDNVDVVVELIGGIEPARSLVMAALEAGKPVVTGNKALIASHGPELFEAASKSKVDLLFEASTAGAIPILRPLRESLLGEDVRRILGIVNGTCNYILTEMTERGLSFELALKQAQELGFAEADPSADVDGYDSAAKGAIMASLAFGTEVNVSNVATEGISNITEFDIAFATELGFTVKLLASAEMVETDGGEEVSVRVFPALVPSDHPLSAVKGSYNAVFVDGAASSELMFYGKGAGGRPTASAVLGDLVDACRNLNETTHKLVPAGPPAVLHDPMRRSAEYYIALDTEDRVGVLAEIAGMFATNQISIQTIEQSVVENDGTKSARMVFITEQGLESDYYNLFQDLSASTQVLSVTSTIRVIS